MITHWLTQFDPASGEPYGSLCDCEIGDDHTLADWEDGEEATDVATEWDQAARDLAADARDIDDQHRRIWKGATR